MFCKRGVLFCEISISWTVIYQFCTKRLFSQETVFFFQIILPEVRTRSFSNESRCSSSINKFRTGALCRIFNNLTEHLQVHFLQRSSQWLLSDVIYFLRERKTIFHASSVIDTLEIL